MTHELKTDPEVFEAILRGEKTFDIRRNDRGYTKSDRLDFKETVYSRAEMDRGAPLLYTGRRIKASISYMLRGPAYGLEEGFVCMGIHVQSRPSNFKKWHQTAPLSENALRALNAAADYFANQHHNHSNAGRSELAEVYENRRDGLHEIALLLGLTHS